MLQRTEIGTKDHVLLWLETKGDEAYDWLTGDCPAGQYSREYGDERAGLNLERINTLAKIEPHTFGALHERASQASWS
jgi:hypothetical protein